ncbi:DUF6207 family protein [Streptomyces flavidovirens]
MEIDEQHITEPGLVVLDITAADEDTVAAVMQGLQQQWATSGITPVWHVPAESGRTRASTPRPLARTATVPARRRGSGRQLLFATTCPQAIPPWTDASTAAPDPPRCGTATSRPPASWCWAWSESHRPSLPTPQC